MCRWGGHGAAAAVPAAISRAPLPYRRSAAAVCGGAREGHTPHPTMLPAAPTAAEGPQRRRAAAGGPRGERGGEHLCAPGLGTCPAVGRRRPGAGCPCLACRLAALAVLASIRSTVLLLCCVPLLSQAHKRGLDVDKLHDSRTPAWRNLRGRSASQRKRSYYEGPEQEDEDDEVEDQPSGSEEEPEEVEEEVGGSGRWGGLAEWACCRVLERASALPSSGRQGTMGVLQSQQGAQCAPSLRPASSHRLLPVHSLPHTQSSEEELGEDEPEGQRRYERRTRHTVQRYSPPKDDQPQLASRGDKRGDRRRADRADRRRQRGYQQDREDSEEEEEVRGWRWRLLLGAARGLGTVLVQLMSEWLHGAAAAAGWGSGCATRPHCPGAPAWRSACSNHSYPCTLLRAGARPRAQPGERAICAALFRAAAPPGGRRGRCLVLQGAHHAAALLGQPSKQQSLVVWCANSWNTLALVTVASAFLSCRWSSSTQTSMKGRWAASSPPTGEGWSGDWSSRAAGAHGTCFTVVFGAALWTPMLVPIFLLWLQRCAQPQAGARRAQARPDRRIGGAPGCC